MSTWTGRRRMSAAEDLLAWQIKAAGLPEPVRQYYYAKPARRLRADFAWLLPPPMGMLLEVQGGIFLRRGGAHGSITGILADIDRLNTAMLYGWRLFRVTPQMIESGEALQLIERALQ